MTQNCIPIRVTGLKNRVYIVAWTHVETVVKLVRKTPNTYVTLNMDELNLTAPEAKATQIIERENYDVFKSEDTRQLKCPPEREKMVEEALRHFKMISEFSNSV